MDVLGIELPEQETELPVEIIALAAERAGYAGDDTAEAAEALIAARAEARAAKDWPWPMPFVMLWASLAWWWKTPPPALAQGEITKGWVASSFRSGGAACCDRLRSYGILS